MICFSYHAAIRAIPQDPASLIDIFLFTNVFACFIEPFVPWLRNHALEYRGYRGYRWSRGLHGLFGFYVVLKWESEDFAEECDGWRQSMCRGDSQFRSSDAHCGCCNAGRPEQTSGRPHKSKKESKMMQHLYQFLSFCIIFHHMKNMSYDIWLQFSIFFVRDFDHCWGSWPWDVGSDLVSPFWMAASQVSWWL